MKTLTLSNLVNAISGFIVTFQIAAKLGVSGFGEFSLYQGALLIACSLFNFKLWEPLIVSLNKRYSFDKVKTSYLLELFISISGYLLITLLISSFSFVFKFEGIELNVFLIIMLNIVFLSMNTFNAIIRYNSNYRVQLVSAILSSTFKIIGIYFVSSSLVSIAIVYTLAECIKYSLTYMLLQLPRTLKIGTFNSRYSMVLLKRGLKLNLTSIIDIPVNYADRFIIGYFLGTEATGLFTICRRIGSFYVLVINSYYQHSYSSVTKMCSDSIGLAKKAVLGNVVLTNVVILLSSLGGWLLFSTLELWGYSNALISDNIIFTLVMISTVGICFSFNYYHPIFLFVNGYIKIVQFAIISNIIYLVTLVISVNSFSIIGGIIPLYIQAITLLFLKIKFINEKQNEKIKISYL